MARIRAFLVLLLAVFCHCAPTHAQNASPAPRVMIVSIDGLRPDVMLRAQAPTLGSLMEAGSFTLWARTTAVAITIPSHVSMVTGVTPRKHGIQWNGNPALPAPIYPKVPTLFELAKAAGITTAMAAGKSKFYVLTRPESLDWRFLPESDVTPDEKVADQAVAIIREHQPRLLFVHFPSVDSAGHHDGWGSPAQLAAVAAADTALGRVLAALEEKQLRAATLIMVTADHGGAGKSHGPDDPRSRHIPWIVVGPGIRRNFDLTQQADLTVQVEDTFAMACRWLGLQPPSGTDGKIVTQAFEHP